jgi:AraC family transcriptional regulator
MSFSNNFEVSIVPGWLIPSAMPIVFSKEKRIPGSWQFYVKRHKKDPKFNAEDEGSMLYNYDDDNAKRFLELRFCVTGQTNCKQPEVNCENCKLNKDAGCVEQTETVDLLLFRFDPFHLSNLINSADDETETSSILNFKYNHTFTRPIQISGRIRHTLDSILNNRYQDSVENIFVNAQTQILLLYCLESMNTLKEDEIPACKFLAYEDEREKIIKAREILLKHIGDPITIRELSRKVAINECYLKKGFKVMFRTTIFDFYQDQRMEHARFLLYEKGFSVSEVSAQLGYSSISHFSTAFKKHTGLKPCELLVK